MLAAMKAAQRPPGLPLPPVGLATRVGVAAGAEPMQFYLDEGRRLRMVIEGMLPEGWDWTGKRVLDFGCGSARVLRHFADEAAEGQFTGCDIDGASIDWAAGHLSPPFGFFRNDPTPPLDRADGSLNLIWAMSVFTHISDTWAEWLGEMHRLLVPGGLLVASFLGEGMWEALVKEPYREDEVGMAVLHSWDGPSAWVFHSEWWLREHWGRAFAVERIIRPPRSSDGRPEITHSYIALKRRDVEPRREILERIDPGEPRELAGLQTSQRLALRDIEYLRERLREPEPRSGLWGGLRRVGRAPAALARRMGR
jgi:SAM-dependent methyltransferase